MKSWQPHQRLLLYLLLALALACAISPILSLGADWFMTQWPALMPQRIPFHRTFDRAFMISGILLFIVCRRALIPARLKDQWRVGAAPASRDFAAGLGLALASMLLVIAAMTVAEVFTPFLRLTSSVAVERVARAAAAGIFAGVFEEIFFRGILFMGLRTRSYDVRAYLLANLFYAALHFVRPGDAYYLDRLDLGAGFRHLGYTFTPFLDPLSLLPGLIGLLLGGAVLSFAVERAGNLYLAIGLHAGWVFSLKTLRVFGDFQREGLGWLFGSSDPKLVSGVATWAAILLAGVAVYYLTKSRAVRSNDLPRAAAA
ncbi:MAG: CPBP family glutamic-type intramembrane protease [Candidatus Binatia bacterium]